MSTWPSAPMFQNRILKAGASAMAMHSRLDKSRMAQEKRVVFIKVPFHMTR